MTPATIDQEVTRGRARQHETSNSVGFFRACKVNSLLFISLMVIGCASLLAVPSVALAEDPPPEVCNGVDDDEDGSVDEGFDVGGDCILETTNAYGTCPSPGVKECNPGDTSTTICVLAEGAELDLAEPEALAAGDVSCFDDLDNDCDGDTDFDDTECFTASELFCNGFDDDNDGTPDDGFFVGDACSEGVGQCARSGVIVCDGDELGASCTASAGSPGVENTPGKFQCVDGLDNDCDGLVDLDDPDCQAAEVCDGLDNNGDGAIDEGFADLGDGCSVGVGACQVAGSIVCNAQGNATQCNAVAGLAGTEGPTGPSCSDGIDNDCDGLTDDADPDCSSADVVVSCSLTSVQKRKNRRDPDTSCEGRFRVAFDTNAAPEFFSAQAIGLNPDGSPIDIAPYPSSVPVEDGDLLHLTSRLDPEAWKVDDVDRFIDVFAPVPMVRATVDTGQTVVEAFCSPVPWMSVDQPTEGQVVSVSEGDVVNVVVPIPRVDPGSIAVVIDGVHIFDETHLNIDPATAFPNQGAPLGGTIDINGQMVTISDIVVDVPADADFFGQDLSSNSFTMTIENLGGGGHIVVVDAEPRPDVSFPNSRQCHLDDILDAGTVAVFGITIENPQANETVPGGNTIVEATVAHGDDIDSAQVQGQDYPVGAQSCNPLEFDAFGETWSVDSCVLDILDSLPQADLTSPLQAGTINVGQNILTVSATDPGLNRTFAQQRFTSGIGTTVPPQALSLAPETRAELISQAVKEQVMLGFDGSPENLQPLDVEVVASDEQTVTLAFTFGITEDGMDGFFGEVCATAASEVQSAIDESLSNTSFPQKTVDGGAACNPKVTIGTPQLNLVSDPVCDTDPENGFLIVQVILPTIEFSSDVSVYCKSTKNVLGIKVCTSKITGGFDLDVSLSDFGFAFNIDEQLVLEGGTGEEPDFITGGTAAVQSNVDIDVGCLLGFVLDVVNVFSFGALDIEADIESGISNALTFDVDIADAVRNGAPDPLEVQKIEVNEDFVEADDLQMDQELLTIKITDESAPGEADGGLVGTIGASFIVPLPEQENVEATVLDAPAPALPIPNVQQLFFAASDDTFNLLFAAMSLKGAFTTDCTDSGLTLEDTLPADCSLLTGDTEFQTNSIIGRCTGMKAQDDAECSALPNFRQRQTCQNTRDDIAAVNISKDTGLLFCANPSIAPRTLVRDNVITPDVVEAELNFNDMPITIVLDRNGNGTYDLDQLVTFAQTCLANGTDPSTDCRWSKACFDLELDAGFELGTTTSGSAQITRTVTGVTDSFGFECGGVLGVNGPALLGEVGNASAIDTIQGNIQDIVRIFEALGLDLGGFVGLSNAKVLAIDVPGYVDTDCLEGDCAEYVGITGDIVTP